MRTRKLARSFGRAALASLMLLCAMTASAAVTIKLGWASPDSMQDPYGIGANAFKEAVEKRSNGEIKVEFYPNRQLGDERQLAEGVRFGTVDASIVTNSVLTQMDPAFMLNDLPFMYTNADQGRQLLDGEVGQILAEKAQSKGIIVLGYFEGGFRHMANNSQPVSAPGDVKGVKYRVMQSPLFIDMFNALGGSAIPMAWGETFTAVQQGTIDGLEGTVGILSAAKLFDVTKYLSLTNHTYSVGELLMSRRFYDRLSDDHKHIVREAAMEAVKRQRELNEKNTETLLADLKGQGLQVNEVADMKPFREAVRPLHDQYREKIGADLYDKAMSSIR
ncbi:TRAP transporter substrate-binding protein [Pollutimonas thiosulfatoxidans]|uniref:Transporter n=1 Tax=Pollutimonas thiosulfatoxidans TaxID=2028345 RepID=A0A410GD56_9BURK|nr:TRAP transporter substrate-binding protein [Pollutimonas thiosulfatoxidans]QAA94223.1 transporter [Pollutimonas thiosulfatoxidans]